MAQAVASRMAKELKMLQTDPPPGVWAGPKGDSITVLEAQLQGPTETVYEGGVFKLEVNVPARYPFEPPKVRFVTPIYHPNIDGEGRICLDILNMPPKGAWRPSLNISTVLASIGLLLSDPNPDDGLVPDITAEFKHQRAVFDAKARQSTQRHAMQRDRGGAEPAGLAAAQQQAQQAQDGAFGPAAAPGARGERERGQQEEHSSGRPGDAQQGQGASENSGAVGNQPAAHGEAPAPAKRARLTLRK